MAHSPNWKHCIRLIEPRDRSLLKGHLLRLDATARRGRFWYNAPVVDLNAYAERVPLHTGVIFGCFPDATLRGIAELRPMDGHQGRHWEGVVSVEAGSQLQGIGQALLQVAMAAARSEGADRIYLRAEQDNAAAGRLARSVGAEISFANGEGLARIDFLVARPQSAAIEQLAYDSGATPRISTMLQ
jgi:GNAT superfamily N-acetyltransferase